MPEAAEHHVPDDILRAAADLGGTVGVAARNLVTGDTVLLNADETFPLASVFKIPVMVEVMRQVDGNTIALDERIILQEDDKSPGSTLIYCHAGLQPTVRDLLYLMITLSDNTATDMLWRRVGSNASTRPCAPSACSRSTASCRGASSSSSRSAWGRTGRA